MKNFRDLQIWQKSHHIVKAIYKATTDFPISEQYGITSQLRRAAVSIPTNIAEGCGRGSDKDFGRFIQISMGSASETEYLLLLAHELNYLSGKTANLLIQEIQDIKKMLTSLLKKIN